MILGIMILMMLSRVGLEECRSLLVPMARVQVSREATFENQFATLVQPTVEYIYISVADNHPPGVGWRKASACSPNKKHR